MGFPSAYLHSTLIHSKGQGQAHLHMNILEERHYYCHAIGSYLWAFRQHIYIRP